MTSLSSAGAVQYPLGDHLGTLRDLASYNAGTNTTTIDNHRRYDSYGNLISETNAAVDQIFGFTGRALDDSTGQQNNLHRWYDAPTGQWVSEDPIGFRGRDSNLNRYVANRVIALADPTGLILPGDTPQDMPGQMIGKHGGVEIFTHGTADAHKPAHAHVCGGGKTTRIGPLGHPLEGQPPLTPKQKKAVEKLAPEIRKILNKVGRRAKQIKAAADAAKEAAKQALKGAAKSAGGVGKTLGSGARCLGPAVGIITEAVEILSDPEEWKRKLDEEGGIIFPGGVIPPLGNRPGMPPDPSRLPPMA